MRREDLGALSTCQKGWGGVGWGGRVRKGCGVWWGGGGRWREGGRCQSLALISRSLSVKDATQFTSKIVEIDQCTVRKAEIRMNKHQIEMRKNKIPK